MKNLWINFSKFLAQINKYSTKEPVNLFRFVTTDERSGLESFPNSQPAI